MSFSSLEDEEEKWNNNIFYFEDITEVYDVDKGSSVKPSSIVDEKEVNTSKDNNNFEVVSEVNDKESSMKSKDSQKEVIIGVEERKESDTESKEGFYIAKKESRSNEKESKGNKCIHSNNKERMESFEEQHAKLFDEFDDMSGKNTKTKRTTTAITRKRTRKQEVKNGDKDIAPKMKVKKRMSRR